ncbi:MAG: hypothetical protein KGO96_07620 [Elusimicrobia bacterium]|nr:hypothetical protein [Elusimicrobiota bacterium]
MDKDKLESFIKSSGLKYKQNQNSWIFDCPKCGKSDKLYIRKKDGLSICWYCASSDNKLGKPEYALAELLRTSIKIVKESLYGDFNYNFSEASIKIEIKDWGETKASMEVDTSNLPLVEFPYYICKPDSEEFKPAFEYLLNDRGINRDLIDFYDIRYDTKHSRIVFPMYIDGLLVGWTDRYIHDTSYKDQYGEIRKVPKSYLNFNKGKCLLFQDKLEGQNHAILCEGPIDCIKTHLCGGGVASFGKNVSDDQLLILINKGIRKIYLGLDLDAFKSTQKIVEFLSFYDVELYLLKPPSHREDLGDCTLEEVYEQFKKAPKISRANIFYEEEA